MAFNNLREFLLYLEKKNDLVIVNEPVSTFLEMTEIQSRVIKNKGPAILFKKPININGEISKIPVLVNLFGSVERVANGINKESNELQEVGKVLAFLKQPSPPDGFKDAIKMLPMLKKVLAMKPSYTNKAPCHEIIYKENDIDLNMLPIQTCWPNEPAPLITWPLVITKGLSKNQNVGIYRMQLINKKQAIMRWLNHRGGAKHFQEWKKANPEKPMPIAVVIGSDPGTILSAVTPTPENMSEFQFAGLLRDKKIDLTNGITVPIKVPANAEIIIEGNILPNKTSLEGPYGDHTGYYNSKEPFPIFEVSAITMRKDPIYLSTYTGRAPDEPSVLGEALNEIFIPLLKQQFPEILDFWLPPEACSYRIAIISINKQYPGHAKRIMMGIWSYLKQFMYTKWVIIVDDDIDIRDWKDVMWAISTRIDPVRDLTLIENTPIDYLDFASPESGLGSKIGLDATKKVSPEVNREWGQTIHMTEKVIEIVNNKWDKLGIPGDGKPIWKKF